MAGDHGVMRAYWIFLSVLCLQAHAEIHNNCGALETTRQAKYCITQDSESHSPDVVYFFHGLRGSEKYWFENMQEAYEIFAEYQIEAPTVVSVSYGPEWLLIEQNTSPLSGLYEEFNAEVLPQLEALIHFDPSQGQRILIGASMGGFNGLQLFLRKQELFSRAAFLCPAITTVGPHDSRDEIWKYIFRTGANPFFVDLALKVSRKYFPTQSDWERHAPLTLGQTTLNSATPRFHISCGNRDEFGFFEGVSKFAGLSSSLHAPVKWQPLNGGHCVYDIRSIFSYLWSLV